jgi:hypothetical protein
MAPIDGVSDIVRLPRLGKVRLGIKVSGEGAKSPYPRATEYFVCPPEIQAEYGEKPTELEIMFPTDEPDQFAQQWLRRYSLTQGLICIGNGEICRRKVDVDTGDAASHKTAHWEWKDGLPCDPQECPEYLRKQCRRIMNLQFLLPKVPGLGVWQIDTSSFYSIININSMVRLLKGALGRCSMIPLTLALGPIEVSPLGLKKKTIYILHIKKDIRWADLARLALLPGPRVLIPEPEAEEPPEDLFPPEVLAEGEGLPKPEKGELSETERLFPPEPEPTLDPEEAKAKEWDEVKRLMSASRVSEAQVRAYFAKEHAMVIGKGLLEKPVPPPGLTLEAVRQLRERLDKYKMQLGGIA